MPFHPSKTCSISIACDAEQTYRYIFNGENLPQWATSFCKSARPFKDAWIITTPPGPGGAQGEVTLKFHRLNRRRILDHVVTLAPGLEILVPMNVKPQGDGCLVSLTLTHRETMTDEQFAQDIEWVERDLRSLKRVLEEKSG